MHFFRSTAIHSWGRIGARTHHVARPRFRDEIERGGMPSSGKVLAIGNCRSYSDVCLADSGHLVDMRGLDRFRSFDPSTGILKAEAGVTLDALLKTFVPIGFFVPVTPGTRFVTLGGAVANDVHGKNHHRSGTFGCHVRSLVLQRSDQGIVRVSPHLNPDLFAATIGGMGLTGIILEVEIQLQRIASSYLDVETVACGDLEALCDGLSSSHELYEHNVAWVDCTAPGRKLGRGILTRANWCRSGPLAPHGEPRRTLPTDRLGLLNPLTLNLFNRCYHRLGEIKAGLRVSHYDPFLYPLDSISNWNRLYGRRGFYQYQCVIPDQAGRAPVRALLEEISSSGEGSFLAVLKRFGDTPSPGLLSFPMAGLTLALDFRNRGEGTLALLRRLDAIVEETGGRLYAAKDLRIPKDVFARGYPSLERFAKHVDPGCESDFSRRVMT